jgi:hypothetical protein
MALADLTYVHRPLIILVDNPISDIQPNGGNGSRYTFAAGLEGLQNTLTIVRVVRGDRGDIAVTNLLRFQQTSLNFAWRSPGRLFYFAFPGVIDLAGGNRDSSKVVRTGVSLFAGGNACVIPLHDNNH